MKKLLLFIFLFTSTSLLLNAQVKYGEEILGKYVEFFSWDYNSEEYQVDEETWVDVRILPEKDYYLIMWNEDEDSFSKIWWQHLERIDDKQDSYETEDGRKIVFDYKHQQVWFFYDSDKLGRYKNVIVVSKLEVLN